MSQLWHFTGKGYKGIIRYRLYLIPLGLALGYWIVFSVLAFVESNTSYHGSLIDPPLPAEDFALKTELGEIWLSDHRGKIVLLYFGYTFCPDVCPATLAKITQVRQELGDDAGKIQIIFVSVDPERDTPQVLGRYARAFSSSFIGGTESPEKITEITKAYGIFYQKRPANANEGYFVDHTSVVWVINSRGEKRMLWSDDLATGDMVKDLRRILREP